MNWEPVIIAWIIFLGIAIISIIAVQTTPGLQKAFRRTAQFMLCIMYVAIGVFAIIAEYYHINFLWAILFAPAVCIIVLILFFLFSSLKEKRKHM